MHAWHIGRCVACVLEFARNVSNERIDDDECVSNTSIFRNISSAFDQNETKTNITVKIGQLTRVRSQSRTHTKSYAVNERRIWMRDCISASAEAEMPKNRQLQFSVANTWDSFLIIQTVHASVFRLYSHSAGGPRCCVASDDYGWPISLFILFFFIFGHKHQLARDIWHAIHLLWDDGSKYANQLKQQKWSNHPYRLRSESHSPFMCWRLRCCDCGWSCILDSMSFQCCATRMCLFRFTSMSHHHIEHFVWRMRQPLRLTGEG